MDSQRVVDASVVSGGWIPTPQEMTEATGVDEASILATRQWAKVVPMMRKIGDYVLANYLKDDPRKAIIMKWKSRYCTPPNQKRKEEMIAPVVGFVYILDSFKNHRGPSEVGRARNTWRKKMLSQIAAKSVWKRTHTAIAKILHNRMNMADSNPGKQRMLEERERMRDPNTPWNEAEYNNLGYPGDENEDAEIEETDETSSSTKPQDEVILEKVEQEAEKNPVNYVEPAEDEEDTAVLVVEPTRKKPLGPGEVPLHAAAQAVDAEADYTTKPPSKADDDDTLMTDESSQPPQPPPPDTSKSGYPLKDEQAKNVVARPLPPPESTPPPSPPPIEDMPQVETTSSAPPPPPAPGAEVVEEALPEVTKAEPVATFDAEVLASNGAMPPPDPPAGEKITQREQELEVEIQQLQAEISQTRSAADLLSKEKDDALKNAQDRLRKLELTKRSLAERYNAIVAAYESAMRKWQQEKSMLESVRRKLELDLANLALKYDALYTKNAEKEADDKKRIETLQDEKARLQEDYNRAIAEGKDLAVKQVELQSTISEYVHKTQELDDRIHELQTQAASSTDEREEKEEEIKKLQEEHGSLAQQVAQLQDELKRLSEQNTQKIKQIQSDKTQLEAELDEARKELARTKEEQERLATAHDEELRSLRAAAGDQNTLLQQLQNARVTLEQHMITENQLREQNKKLEQQINEQKTTISIQHDEIERLKAEVQDLVNKNFVLSQKLLEINAKYEQTAKKLKDYIAIDQSKTAEINQLRSELFKLKNQLTALQRTLNETTAKLKAQTDELAENENKIIAKYKQKMEELRIQWESTEKQYKAQINELNDQLQTARGELKDLRADIITKNTTLQANRAQIASNEAEILRITTTANALLTTNDAELQGLRSQIAAASQSIATKDKDLETISGQLADATRHAITLQTSLNVKGELLEKILNSVRSLVNALSKKEDVSTISSLIVETGYETPDRLLVIKLNRLLEQVQNLQAEVKRLSDLQLADAAKLSTVTEERDTLASQLRTSEEEKTKKLQELEAKNKELLALNTQLSAEIRRVQESLASQEERMTELLNARGNLEDELNRANKTIERKIVQECDTVQNSNIKLQYEIDRLQEENTRLLREKEDLVKELSAAEARVSPNAAPTDETQAYIRSLLDQVASWKAIAEETTVRDVRARRIPVGYESVMEEEENEAMNDQPASSELNFDDNVRFHSGFTVEMVGRYRTLIPVSITYKGKRKRFLLNIDWKLNVNPDKGPNMPGYVFYSDRFGNAMNDSSARDLGLPSPALLKQQIFDMNNNEPLDTSLKTPIEKKPEYRAMYDNTIRNMQQTNENTVLTPVIQDAISYGHSLPLNVEDPPEFLYDPLQLRKIYQDHRTSSYATRLQAMLKPIFEYLRKKYPSYEEQKAFLTDPNFVDEARRERIAHVLSRHPDQSPLVTAEMGIMSVIGDEVKSGLLTNTKTKWFRDWLRTLGFAANMNVNNNFYSVMEPEIVYHTISKAVNDVLALGRRGLDDARIDVLGFGYRNGQIPIPHMVQTNPSNFPDYYGYGFNPFSKKLNSTPAYYTEDYHGY